MVAVEGARSADAKVVGLVGAGHFFSHFYGLVLPPLFPLLKADFSVSYLELGLLISTLSLASAIVQLPAGFFFDRYGALGILVLGLILRSLSVLLMGLASSYGMLLVLAVLAGVGNSVFHPADYAILSARVRGAWLGRAFSLHTFAGHLGWALAPVVMVGLAAAWGWRAGLVAVGLAGLATALLLFANRRALTSRPVPPEDDGGRSALGTALRDLRGLMSLPILACFAFFLLISMAMGGFDAFFVAAMVSDRGLTITAANTALTALFGGSAVGLLIGGVLADRTERHGLVAAAGLGVTALLILLLGEISVSAAVVVTIMALAGLGQGIVPPSRDLMVRAATPQGATGKVFAFVSTGLDIGGVITPVLFGMVLDGGEARWMFWLTAAILGFAIGTVFVSQSGRSYARETRAPVRSDS